MTAGQRTTLAAVILGSGVVTLDGLVVTLALPQIGVQLPATLVGTLEGQTYVTSGYLATLAAFLIIGGAIGDRYGRRRVFLLGLLGFGAASVLCGLAGSIELLVAARLLQGMTGAILIPGSLAIITGAFEEPLRTRAIGIWAASGAAMAMIGPPLGGILVELAGWRSVFLINIPLVAAGAWLVWARMPVTDAAEPARRRFDWLGAGVVTIAVGGLAFGAIRGQERHWADGLAFAALGIGLVAAASFVPLMARRADPLVPLGLFRNRDFATINLATLLIYGSFYAFGGLQALFLQSTLGYTPLGAALAGLPVTFLITLLSVRVGAVARRIGVRRFLVAGPLVMASAQLWWLTVPATSVPWMARLSAPGSLVPPIDAVTGPIFAAVLFGFGFSLLVTPLTATLMGSAPAASAGIVSAVNNALARVGQPLFAAVSFIVVSALFHAMVADLMYPVPGIEPGPPGGPGVLDALQPLNPPPIGASETLAAAVRTASTTAFHGAAVLSAVLLAVGALVNVAGGRDRTSSGA